MTHHTLEPTQVINDNSNKNTIALLLARLNVQIKDVSAYTEQHRRFSNAAESTITLIVERLSLLTPKVRSIHEPRPNPELMNQELQLIETQLNACAAAISQAKINVRLATDNLETQSSELARPRVTPEKTAQTELDLGQKP